MAINLALDTNRYRDLCRGNPAIVAAVAGADTVWLPFVVMAELLAGFAAGSRGFENEAILRRFLLKPRVGVLYPDHHTVRVYAGLYQQLRRQGTPIPTHDLWIAAIVVQHELTLLTRDAHFNVLPQLSRLDEPSGE